MLLLLTAAAAAAAAEEEEKAEAEAPADGRKPQPGHSTAHLCCLRHIITIQANHNATCSTAHNI
jgi:hypothetical protein